MAEQSINNNAFEEIEHLHQSYLNLRDNTPYTKRNGNECQAYHAWYDAAYVFFSSIDEFKVLDDFKTFVNAEKDGNCFVLEHVYHRISASYKVLMNKVKEMESRNVKTTEDTRSSLWPFETNDDHRRVFVSYSWDNDSHKEWVFKLCQDLRSKGVDAIIDQAMRKGKDLLDFMEKGIANAHRVLVVGTPNYKRKSEEEKGGVKYEQNIIKASILHGIGSDRYITILREGESFEKSFPAVISTKGGYDMRNDGDYQEHLTALVHEIYDMPVVVLNPIGAVPEFARQDENNEGLVKENANDNYVTLVKRYLSSSEYNIAFNDLITKMTNDAFQKIMEKANYNIELRKEVLDSYSDYHHAAVSDLMDAAILTAQWGNFKQLEIFGQVLMKLSSKPFVNGQIERDGSGLLHGIGVQFLFNVVGMACVKYERFAELNKILSLSIPSPHFRDLNIRQSVIRVLGEQYWNNYGLNQLLGQNYYYPWTVWLKDYVCHHFDPYVIVESEIEPLYYIWEQLKSLAFGYNISRTTGQVYFTTGFFLHYRVGLVRNVGSDDPYSLFYGDADRLKEDWPPIKQGLFGGNYDHYQELVKQAEEYYKRVIRL